MDSDAGRNCLRYMADVLAGAIISAGKAVERGMNKQAMADVLTAELKHGFYSPTATSDYKTDRVKIFGE